MPLILLSLYKALIRTLASCSMAFIMLSLPSAMSRAFSVIVLNRSISTGTGDGARVPTFMVSARNPLCSICSFKKMCSSALESKVPRTAMAATLSIMFPSRDRAQLLIYKIRPLSFFNSTFRIPNSEFTKPASGRRSHPSATPTVVFPYHADPPPGR